MQKSIKLEALRCGICCTTLYTAYISDPQTGDTMVNQ